MGNFDEALRWNRTIGLFDVTTSELLLVHISTRLCVLYENPVPPNKSCDSLFNFYAWIFAVFDCCITLSFH